MTKSCDYRFFILWLLHRLIKAPLHEAFTECGLHVIIPVCYGWLCISKVICIVYQTIETLSSHLWHASGIGLAVYWDSFQCQMELHLLQDCLFRPLTEHCINVSYSLVVLTLGPKLELGWPKYCLCPRLIFTINEKFCRHSRLGEGKGVKKK